MATRVVLLCLVASAASDVPGEPARLRGTISSKSSGNGRKLQSKSGQCCFNGCDPNSCSDSDWCSTEENCLKPQSQGGCNSNTTGGATPTWCPAQAELQARVQQGQSLTAVACPASFVLEDVCSWEYPGCTDYTCDAHSAKPAESLKCCGHGIDFQGYLDHANPGCYAKYTDINDCWSWTSSDEPGLLQQASSSATGRCCFNGCDPNSCSDSEWCSTEENCLKPQSQGGCNSNTTGGATPTWCSQ